MCIFMKFLRFFVKGPPTGSNYGTVLSDLNADNIHFRRILT